MTKDLPKTAEALRSVIAQNKRGKDFASYCALLGLAYFVTSLFFQAGQGSVTGLPSTATAFGLVMSTSGFVIAYGYRKKMKAAQAAFDAQFGASR